MFKKITVLAMALGALAAFALPVAATADWQHGGVNIKETKQVTIQGTDLRFTSQLGGVQCKTQTVADFEVGTTGKITTFEAEGGNANTTASCNGTGGLAFCQIHAFAATSLPWVLHTTGSTPSAQITVTTGQIHTQATGGFCPASNVTLEPGTVHFTVASGEQGAVSTAQLDGTLQGNIDGQLVTTTDSGTVHVSPAGTYGL